MAYSQLRQMVPLLRAFIDFMMSSRHDEPPVHWSMMEGR
jgi:hypothetical protein